MSTARPHYRVQFCRILTSARKSGWIAESDHHIQHSKQVDSRSLQPLKCRCNDYCPPDGGRVALMKLHWRLMEVSNNFLITAFCCFLSLVELKFLMLWLYFIYSLSFFPQDTQKAIKLQPTSSNSGRNCSMQCIFAISFRTAELLRKSFYNLEQTPTAVCPSWASGLCRSAHGKEHLLESQGVLAGSCPACRGER